MEHYYSCTCKSKETKKNAFIEKVWKKSKFYKNLNYTVPLRGKLTVPRSSLLETVFSILDSQKL